MKKLIVFILLFACVGVQQIQAQKWLKTLGKVASTLLDDDVSGTIPDCTLKYTDCKHNGNDVHINYVLTSQLGKDAPLWFDAGSNNTYAVDSKSAKHTIEFIVGGERMGTYSNKNIPSKVPVKLTVVVKDVERSVASIRSCVIKGKFNNSSEQFTWNIGAKTPAAVVNTSADNIVCTMPQLAFTLKECKRLGDNVIITAMLKNTGGKDLEFDTSGTVTIYDNEGEACRLNGDMSPVANGTWGQYSNIRLVKGIPVKAKFVVTGVSDAATQFSILKFEFSDMSGSYYIEIRNQAISAQ